MDLIGSDPTERRIAALFDYYGELEMLVALLVAEWGQPHEGGFRLTIPREQAWRLREQIGSSEPVVIKQYQADKDQYVIDVL